MSAAFALRLLYLLSRQLMNSTCDVGEVFVYGITRRGCSLKRRILRCHYDYGGLKRFDVIFFVFNLLKRN